MAFFSANAKPLSMSPPWQAESTTHTFCATCGQQQCEAAHGARPPPLSAFFAAYHVTLENLELVNLDIRSIHLRLDTLSNYPGASHFQSC